MGGNLSVSFLVRDSDSAAVDTMGTTTFDDCISIGTLNANGMVDVEFPLRELARSGSYGMSVAVCRVSRRDCADNFVFD